MCGISGIVQLQGSSNQLPTILKNMNDKLKHRGPDDEGFTLFKDGKAQCFSGQDTPKTSIDSNLPFAPKSHIDLAKEHPVQVGFGHRRLAIIDLSAGGHQPMCLQENQEIWITLNGEIYNYIELREELRAYGYAFQTESDVEVVLASYQHWGTDCLTHFNGMWSFVLYDIEKNQLFGARDRFGVKPLYYSQNEQHFAFASEQKALLEGKLATLQDTLTQIQDERAVLEDNSNSLKAFGNELVSQLGSWAKQEFSIKSIWSYLQEFDGAVKKYQLSLMTLIIL
jgi:asparagine synthase (glutamine-hydrolysing)